MITRADIEHLAELSRLKLTSAEIDGLEKDLPSILEYVGQVSAANVGSDDVAPVLHTVMRDDVAVPHALGDDREALLSALPHRDGDYAVVRKIIQK